MSFAVVVKHNAETAHRLPHLPGKCVSLHGHSWWFEITVEAPTLGQDGLLVEFGPLKKQIRTWIDTHIDHGVMLGPQDPLLPLLRANDCKVHEVPGYPTVENVAAMLADVAADALERLAHAPGAHVSRVHVQETHVNAATWTPTYLEAAA
jgi:6-pyruvoyltetrahydropterin/6-carboxytetrahydropterin synthase